MKRRPKDSWSLYIAECADGSYYTGIAKDVQKRIETHNSGKGAKYTSTHAPVKLLFQEAQRDYSTALRREYQIKRLPKERKVRFAAGEALAPPAEKSQDVLPKETKKKAHRGDAETSKKEKVKMESGLNQKGLMIVIYCFFRDLRVSAVKAL